ncbi:MAG: MBL fold metallo-hydrolase [Gammaproteobacteria bacterium]|nr:MBL fold metallo-hydrolase [Gammaproteobacteria bacterium]
MKSLAPVIFASVTTLFSVSATALETSDVIEARQHVFGAENVNADTGDTPQDKVIFSWLSASSFAASVAGKVFMLDTYMTRQEIERGRTPLVVADLVNLNPEAILLGHGHGDHADNAAYIAAHTGAMIYATEETCGTLQVDFERMLNDPLIMDYPDRRFPDGAKVNCTPVTSTGSTPGTEVYRLPFLEPVACTVAFRHMHSVAVDPDSDFPPTPVKIIVDERDDYLFPGAVLQWPSWRNFPENFEPVAGQFNTQTTPKSPGGNESLFFNFILRDGSKFSFVYHNTAGALKEGKGRGWDGTPEDGQRIIGLLETLGPTDVQLGTAATGNFDNNGLRDLIMYQAAIQPKIYIPNHITTGSRAKEGSSISVYRGYLDQMDLMNVAKDDRPRLHWLVDPVDYIKPIVYHIDNPAWEDDAKEELTSSGYCAALDTEEIKKISLE